MHYKSLSFIYLFYFINALESRPMRAVTRYGAIVPFPSFWYCLLFYDAIDLIKTYIFVFVRNLIVTVTLSNMYIIGL